MAVSYKDVLQGGASLPPRLLLYGVEGIGKTTIGASAPNPIFIQTEDGLGLIEVPTFPLATSYEDVHGALTALATEEHDRKTLVVDSLDWLEPLIWKHTAGLHEKQSIEDFGYGKGYIEALTIWSDFLNALTYLRSEKGMTVILIAHHEVKRFDDPNTEPYDRYGPKLHKLANAKMKEWADAILFANYRVATTQSDMGFNKKKTRAIGSGERLLFTEERPAFVAKNRFGMPPELPLSWNALEQALPFYPTPEAPAPAAASDKESA